MIQVGQIRKQLSYYDTNSNIFTNEIEKIITL